MDKKCSLTWSQFVLTCFLPRLTHQLISTRLGLQYFLFVCLRKLFSVEKDKLLNSLTFNVHVKTQPIVGGETVQVVAQRPKVEGVADPELRWQKSNRTLQEIFFASCGRSREVKKIPVNGEWLHLVTSRSMCLCERVSMCVMSLCSPIF